MVRVAVKNEVKLATASLLNDVRLPFSVADSVLSEPFHQFRASCTSYIAKMTKNVTLTVH